MNDGVPVISLIHDDPHDGESGNLLKSLPRGYPFYIEPEVPHAQYPWHGTAVPPANPDVLFSRFPG